MVRRIAGLVLGMVLALAPLAARAGGWRIDREVRFHHAWFDPSGATPACPCEDPAPAGFFPAAEADITNIALSGLLGLGFPVPARDRPERWKFYLKFYAFPEAVDPAATAERVLGGYALARMAGGEDVIAYASRRENLWIKKGAVGPADRAFSADRPFPPLTVSRAGGGALQAAFDSRIPFSSLYVTPAGAMSAGLSRDRRAAWSARGVSAFRDEIAGVFRAAFAPVACAEPDRLCFAAVERNGARPDGPVGLTVLRLPERASVFANYADLPMPQDPKRVFLTGLVLIRKTVHAGSAADAAAVLSGDVRVDSAAFAAKFPEIAAHVLEIGSVAKFTD